MKCSVVFRRRNRNIFFQKAIDFTDILRYNECIGKGRFGGKELLMLPKQTDYKVGIYLRLSRDDERTGESLSIENQRTILTKYIEEQQGWTLYDEYVDDGISGTDLKERA